MRRGSRLATRRWRASISRATSSTRSGTTPSLHARHNTPHVALNCACVLTLAAALAVSPVHQPAIAAEVHAAAYQRGGLETFRGEELIASGHHFFGTASKGLGMTVQEAVRRWGEPNGYIVGQE